MVGGARKGAGRPKKEPTKLMRVPLSLVAVFERVLRLHALGVSVVAEIEVKPLEGEAV